MTGFEVERGGRRGRWGVGGAVVSECLCKREGRRNNKKKK